jgi:rod shape-determining protein MreC
MRQISEYAPIPNSMLQAFDVRRVTTGYRLIFTIGYFSASHHQCPAIFFHPTPSLRETESGCTMPGLITRQRKILFILFLFTLLFWLVTWQVKNGRFSFMEKPVLAVSGFFERIITGTFDFVKSAGVHYVFLVQTQKENDRLREQNDRLRLESAVLNELLSENERLRDALKFKQFTPPQSVVAEVIGKEMSPISATLTINKGADHGIKKDMAVIAASGVVGRVQAVFAGSSKIILLTDPGNTLAVRVQRNREEGLLEGKLVNCALKYVSYYADIQQGDLLVTSGLDGIYPKGLAVATIVKVTKRDASAFQTVVAEPIVRFSRLEEALVLTR